MTKNEFKKFMENYPVFLDGATGSNLQKMGMPFGVCTEKWITENEDVLEYALKNYCGRAAVKFNDADNKALYDISYKYGACII